MEEEEDDQRFVENPFRELWKAIEVNRKQLQTVFMGKIIQFQQNVPVPCIQALCSDPSHTAEDYGMFQGAAGYLFLYLRLYRYFSSIPPTQTQKLKEVFKYGDAHFYKTVDPAQYLQKAKAQFAALVELAKRKVEKKRIHISFCMSKATIYLGGAHLGVITNDNKLIEECTQQILKYHTIIMQNQDIVEKQWLYGVPGYMYLLLDLQKIRGPGSISPTDLTKQIHQIADVILKIGLKGYEKVTGKKVDLSKPLPPNFRLAYTFGDKQYLGGAHGLSGGLQMLFLTLTHHKPPKQLAQMIATTAVPSVAFLIKHIKNGNLPTRANSNNYDLVQFCHGAPGAITPLLYFCSLFPHQANTLKVKQNVISLYQHIWRYGILKKGFDGICHGIAGNAYPFISPISKKVLPDLSEQLHRKAGLMWMLQLNEQLMKQINSFEFEDRYVVGMSDYPYSMMLGMVGGIHFNCDLLEGEGVYPGYDI